jgi:hypothetical protein
VGAVQLRPRHRPPPAPRHHDPSPADRPRRRRPPRQHSASSAPAPPKTPAPSSAGSANAASTTPTSRSRSGSSTTSTRPAAAASSTASPEPGADTPTRSSASSSATATPPNSPGASSATPHRPRTARSSSPGTSTPAASPRPHRRPRSDRSPRTDTARDWILEYVTDHPGTPAQPSKTAFADHHGRGGSTLARKAIDGELNGEYPQLAVGNGKSPSGKYLYPASTLNSQLAVDPNGEYGESNSASRQEDVIRQLADSPLPRRGKASGESTPDQPDDLNGHPDTDLDELFGASSTDYDFGGEDA